MSELEYNKGKSGTKQPDNNLRNLKYLIAVHTRSNIAGIHASDKIPKVNSLRQKPATSLTHISRHVSCALEHKLK